MTTIRDVPVLAICGRAGSHKAAVLTAVAAGLRERGLRIAVLDDAAGGGSRSQSAAAFADQVAELLADHDMALVTGDGATPAPTVWCGDRIDPSPPSGIADLRLCVPWGDEPAGKVLDVATRCLEQAQMRRPVYGAVLIGGASRRMGFPKHLAVVDGETMLERILRIVGARVDRIVVVGAGRIPDGLIDVEQVVDEPECGAGPLAGLLTALRLAPRACWVVVACDMPAISGQAIEWLQQRRAPGRWAVIPQSTIGRLEPLLAIYEPQARSLFEELLIRGDFAPAAVAKSARVHTPLIPESLRRHWANVNRPQDLALVGDEQV